MPITSIPVKDKIEGQRLKVSLMKAVVKPSTPHRHADYHELIVLSGGSGYHEIDTHTYEIIAPVVYYLRPGQTHCWNFTSIPSGYVILFREELLKKEDIELLYSISSQISGDSSAFAIAKQFYEDFKISPQGEAVYSAYLHLLLSKIRYLSSAKSSTPVIGNQLFHKYKRLVNEKYSESRLLSFYAEQLNVTAQVLNDICKSTVGRTASNIINERILLEAKILLGSTSKPINEIAIELQFSDYPHFANFFKKHANITPRKYRLIALAKK